MRIRAIIVLYHCAGLPVAFGTSHVALKERANLQPGQTVLVLGAAGGVGIAAVQVHSALLGSARPCSLMRKKCNGQQTSVKWTGI
jgi:NADPH:quinone reductase-like Zn-dependent oxidoreductase